MKEEEFVHLKLPQHVFKRLSRLCKADASLRKQYRKEEEEKNDKRGRKPLPDLDLKEFVQK